MPTYDNEMKFVLFKNDKGDNQSRPDYRGETTIDGKTYRISGWVADVKSGPKAGQKYIRGTVELDTGERGRGAQAPAQARPAVAQQNMDEPPPF